MDYTNGRPARNRHIQLLGRTAIDMSYLPNQTSETRVLVSRIPVLDASDDAGSSLLVRVHNVRIATGGANPGSLVVALVDDVWTSQDANQTFLGSSAIAGAEVTLDSSTIAGTFSRPEITGNLGSMAALRIVGTQDATTGFLSLMAEISVDLLLKAG